MALVGDRDVAPDGQLEVAAAEAQHHRAVDRGRPHERAVDELPDDVQHGIAAVAHCLGEAAVVTRTEGDGVRAGDAGQAQQPGRLGDAVGIRLVVVGNRQDGVAGCLLDPLDATRRVAVEDRGVLGIGHARGGIDQRLKVRILRAALDGVHLLAGQLEVCAELDEGQRLAAGRLDVGDGPRVERLAAPRIHRGRGRAERAVEIDQLPAGELQLEDAGGLGVDLLPRLGRQRRELALQVVHSPSCPPFRLPMPSEPPPPRCQRSRRCRPAPWRSASRS